MSTTNRRTPGIRVGETVFSLAHYADPRADMFDKIAAQRRDTPYGPARRRRSRRTN